MTSREPPDGSLTFQFQDLSLSLLDLLQFLLLAGQKNPFTSPSFQITPSFCHFVSLDPYSLTYCTFFRSVISVTIRHKLQTACLSSAMFPFTMRFEIAELEISAWVTDVLKVAHYLCKDLAAIQDCHVLTYLCLVSGVQSVRAILQQTTMEGQRTLPQLVLHGL